MGSVDLDSQQFVVWNMGLIAANGHPDALDLFRKVMLASASIPIAFPPVFFEVEADGRRYDEMHVDGFVAANIFLNAGLVRPSLIHERAGRGAAREDIFVIHNGQLIVAASPTRAVAARDRFAGHRRLGPLWGGRGSHSASMRSRGATRRASIGSRSTQSVDLPGSEVFDPVKMAELYEIGRKAALAGPVWSTRPPGLWDERAP